MNHDRIERLSAAMTANKIKVNKHFNNVVEHGFTDEARESFFEEVIDDLEGLIRHGVNSDFNKSMKESVIRLVDIAVKCGEEGRRTASLEKLRMEKRDCMDAIKLSREFKPAYDMCANVRDYIETAKDGMEVLQEDSGQLHTGVENANMEKCRGLFDDISGMLDKVVDVSSRKAGDKYNEVITKLRSWRIKVARSGGMYDASAVELLRDVLRTVRSWSELCSATFGHAKIQDLYEIPVDDLTKSIESVSIKQNIEMFLNRCDAYAKETLSMRNNGVTEKIMESRARLRELEKQELEIVDQFKKGLLEREDAEYALQNLKDDKDYIKFDIERLEIDRVSREEVSMRREMISKLERPVRQCFNYVKNNRLHIYALFNGMDFSRLVGMVNNSVSTQEFAQGIAEMQEVLVSRGIINSQGKVLMENLKHQLALVDQVTTEEMPVLAELEKEKEKESGGSLLDQLLQKDADKTAEAQKNPQQAQQLNDIL